MDKEYEKGAYDNIVLDIFLHDEEGFRHFIRMNYEQFIDVTEMIAPIVSKTDTVMRKAICPKQRLAWTLRFLATGESFRSLEYQFRVSRKFVSYIIDEVCKAIVTVLAETYLKFPSCQKNWKNIQKSLMRSLGVISGHSTIITEAQTQLSL